MKTITYIYGNSEVITDAESYEEEEKFVKLLDKDDEEIAAININQIRKIE